MFWVLSHLKAKVILLQCYKYLYSASGGHPLCDLSSKLNHLEMIFYKKFDVKNMICGPI